MQKSLIKFSTFATVIIAIAACQINERSALPVTLIAKSARGGSSPELLERGRSIYLTRCTECHTAQPIGHYSIERWHKIVAWMGPYAKLDESGQAALLAYLDSARRSIP